MVPLVTCCLAESNIATSSVRIVRCIVFWIITYNNNSNGMNIQLSCNENRMFSFYNISELLQMNANNGLKNKRMLIKRLLGMIP